MANEEDCTREFKAKERSMENVAYIFTMVSSTQECTPRKPVKLANITDGKRFSDATKLFRVTALSLKFIRDLKSARNLRERPKDQEPTLTAEETRDARNLWIRQVQDGMKNEGGFESLKQQLGVFKDNRKRGLHKPFGVHQN